MPAHFLDGPAVGQMVNHDLRDANTRQPFQPGRFAGWFGDVRIGDFNRHDRKMADTPWDVKHASLARGKPIKKSLKDSPHLNRFYLGTGFH
jgi:hypothetical protein